MRKPQMRFYSRRKLLYSLNKLKGLNRFSYIHIAGCVMYFFSHRKILPPNVVEVDIGCQVYTIE